MSGRTRMGSTAAVVLTAIAVTSCGSGTEPEAKPAIVISAAVDKTMSGTAKVSGVTALEGDGEGERFVVQRMTGEQDFRSDSSSVRSTSPLPDGDPARTVLVVDAISIGDIGYQRIEGLDLPPGKEWVRMTGADLGVPDGAAESIGSGDPADGLQFLEGLTNARERGSEPVRGEPTTKYTVTLDLERLLDLVAKGVEKLDPGFQEGLEALRDQVDLSRIPGAVWLDESGRVRRLDITMTLRERKLRVVSTVEYYDFGAAVSISAPPEAETVPFADVVGVMRQFFAELEPQPGSEAAA